MMQVGILSENSETEKRVSLTPQAIPPLLKAGYQLLFEPGAGHEAGYTDQEYEEKGAIPKPRNEVLKSEILLFIRIPGADFPSFPIQDLKKGQTLIGFCDPLGNTSALRVYADLGVNIISMEMIPRISRAQSMDALSSMASIAGYKAVIEAARELPKMFPLMMTSAGSVRPANVLVLGAGVAGLQAIATARRLGAVVSGYDVRPEVREQVASLGAKFLEVELDTTDAAGQGGYAKERDEKFYEKQRVLMMKAVSESDVVITTAAIPGKRSPVLVTKEMVEQMKTGSVLIDLAAERGGNCELTKADQRVRYRGVTILGPTNLPSTVAFHASQMYGKNISTLLLHFTKESHLSFDFKDEIIREATIIHEHNWVNERIKSILDASKGAA